MTSLADIWSRLAAVRSLRFEAWSAAATGWDGVGVGTVDVSQPGPGEIVFAEAGEWQSPGRTPTRFRSTFRWSAGEASIRLEHLRFGPDAPVYLFDFVPGPADTWRAACPHQCGADDYSASLSADGERLVVAWTVVGPRKRESIHYTYR